MSARYKSTYPDSDHKSVAGYMANARCMRLNIMLKEGTGESMDGWRDGLTDGWMDGYFNKKTVGQTVPLKNGRANA